MNHKSRLPDMSIELEIGNLVAGIDEAGRGPLAGPVVAAAVVLDPKLVPGGIRDSKTINPFEREQVYKQIILLIYLRILVGIIHLVLVV